MPELYICQKLNGMTNKEVASALNRLAKIMELHGENQFRIRNYSAAYITVRKLPFEVFSKEKEELEAIKGIGKSTAAKIIELKETGGIDAFNQYAEKTPDGILEMLDIKGLGPKKIRTVWKDMGIESPGELLYACSENRLLELKGFGPKTQSHLREQLIYFLDSKGKYLYGHILDEAEELMDRLQNQFPHHKFECIGEFRRKMPIVNGIEIITTLPKSEWQEKFESWDDTAHFQDTATFKHINVQILTCEKEKMAQTLFEQSCSTEFLQTFQKNFSSENMSTEEEFFTNNGLAHIPPEARDLALSLELARNGAGLDIIEDGDIKGVIHTHSTWSDGINSIEEMAKACMDKGYEYLVMSDHSKAAFYANGLTEDRVLAQMDEIERLNDQLEGFTIFKSIECDILSDGRLDYGDDFLSHFDLVIASIHSNLKMDEDKAMNRLLNAIKNEHTRILGHPTGRLLLSRPGYPVDHQVVIDSCAEHDVVIELNANPYRLDLDWTWIPYAIEKGVQIAINPDAHSIKGIDDIRHGVSVARKALLHKKSCLNCKSAVEFGRWINNS